MEASRTPRAALAVALILSCRAPRPAASSQSGHPRKTLRYCSGTVCCAFQESGQVSCETAAGSDAFQSMNRPPTLSSAARCAHGKGPGLTRRNAADKDAALKEQQPNSFASTQPAPTARICEGVTSTASARGPVRFLIRSPALVLGAICAICRCRLERPARLINHAMPRTDIVGAIAPACADCGVE
jgi:hypothetical protein